MILNSKQKEVAEAIKQLRHNPAFVVLLAQIELATNTSIRQGAYAKDGSAAWHGGRTSVLLELYDELTETKGAASGGS